MTLVPRILRVVDEWHREECPTAGCHVWLGEGGLLSHGLPPSTAPSPAPEVPLTTQPPKPSEIVT